MKEHPILFSGQMVRAILEGRKTQTRRVCKDQAYFERCGYKPDEAHTTYSCPYGQVGDRLWVREAFQYLFVNDRSGANHKTGEGLRINYEATDGRVEFVDDDSGEMSDRLWPSIHMPRWASRIALEITNVRVEKVQRISNRDARSEGVRGNDLSGDGGGCDYRFPFQQLWDSINAKRGFGWEVNPWVWAITFERVQ